MSSVGGDSGGAAAIVPTGPIFGLR